MTSTPPPHATGHAFLVSMCAVLEQAQSLDPKPERAELLELLRPLRNQLAHSAGSPVELDAASTQMQHHLEQFATTSLGSPEIQQIIQLADRSAAARILVRSEQINGKIIAKNTFDELLELPRGRGMMAGDVADRIGPGLRIACGVTTVDSPATARRKVASRLVELCESLPSDLRISVLAALALHPAANHQFMQDRMGWAARQINRDHPRAAVRRMKIGFRILAEQLEDLLHDPRIHQGWHTWSLRAVLRLDVDPPQVEEDRAIVVSADGLEEIEIRFSAPADDPSADSPILASMLYGGEITRTERVTAGHRKFGVRLPTQLRAGEKHEYGVRFAAFPRALMPPFYVLTPLQPCERFTVRVRFGANVPKWIWQVDGIPPRAIDDYEPADGLLTADRLGEVSVEFTQLRQGLSYGVRWSEQG